MGDYVQSQRATRVVGEVLGTVESGMGDGNGRGTVRDPGVELQGRGERRVRIQARTGRRWLKKNGLHIW